MHARTAFWPFITNNHDVTGFDLAAKNTVDRIFLTFIHHGRTTEFEDTFIHASGFYDAAVNRQVAFEYGKATILTECVRFIANTPLLAIVIERIPTAIL
ncbi:Uncharacterised protein [Vibrio cholerae]|uniref:Uncharacterized protein n=1 Tax=Vibrio cholerae TaxID=666 RepID=A0A655YQZ8_VIBCL|nr:Uncharacterised protein [Vibrio cholerae]